MQDDIPIEIPMESRYRVNSGTGLGWAGTQTCFYNCVAPEFLVEAPKGGISWVIGSGANSDNKVLPPASWYFQQLKDRLGLQVLKQLVSDEQVMHIGQYRWLKERLHKEDANYQRIRH